MRKKSPGELLRRFVLDFLVEEALEENPMVDGDGRRALGASFSVEPMVDLGNIRKYRIISTRTASNRRVYLFLFRRPSSDRAFRTTELCFRRCVMMMRSREPGAVEKGKDVIVREELRRQKSLEDVGLLLTEVVGSPPDAPPSAPSRFSEIPKSLVDLGVLEIYPEGTLAQGAAAQGARDEPAEGSFRLAPKRDAAKGVESVGGRSGGLEGQPAEPLPTSTPQVSVQDWLRQAYRDTFGEEPVHVATASRKGPVFAVRVLEISEKHDQWVVEVTRHLRIREGSLDLEVRLLEVK
jgi:hypothetical protein